MMAFLLDDADEKDHANERDDVELVAEHHERQKRANPRRGRVERIVSGCT